MKKFLTVAQVALELGTTERAIWQRIYRRQIPHRRWGHRVLIPADDLARFLELLPGVSVEEA